MSRAGWLVVAALAAFSSPALADERDDEIFGGSEGSEVQPASAGGDAVPASADRDDEIFGDAESSEAPPAEPPSNEAQTFGEEGLAGGLLSDAEVNQRLGKAGSKLDIGGLLYLRAQFDGAEGVLPEDTGMSSPSLFDLYMDGRPSDDLRVFARGRITHRFAAPQAGLFEAEAPAQTTVALDQLWLKFDVEDTLFVTAGRQPIKWGAGRFWNPTDFLNEQARDPLAVFDERLGVGLVKLHLPVESSGWNLYAIANFEGANALSQVGGAFRVEKLIDSTEITLSTAMRKDQPFRVGGDVSFPLWFFDVRAEVALTHGDSLPYYRDTFDLSSFEDVGAAPEKPWDPNDSDWQAWGQRAGAAAAAVKLPTAYSRENEWIPQAVLGADVDIPYGDDDSFNVGAEYFYNGAGYDDDAALIPWLLMQGRYRPLYVGRHYAGIFASAVGPGRWNDTTLILSLLGNLSDRSYQSRFDYRVRLLTYLDVNTFVGYAFGEPGEFKLGLHVPRLAGLERVPADVQSASGLPSEMSGVLAQGIEKGAPVVTAGAGLSLRF